MSPLSTMTAITHSRIIRDFFIPVSDEEEDDTSSLLDAFDFDESLPNIINDNYCRLTTPSPTTVDNFASNSGGSSVSKSAASFMLGDYSEKEHFLPSSSVIRNEVLEGYIIMDTDANENSTKQQRAEIGCVAFRCIHCKYVKERSKMAVIRPQNLMAIRDTFISFQESHMQKCTHIPKDIRQCYTNFKRQEHLHHSHFEVDQFLWVSIAIRRGLRDNNVHGGILYYPELVARQDLEDTKSVGYCLERYLESENLHQINDIIEPHPNDVQVGSRTGVNNNSPGNIFWWQLMNQVRSNYMKVALSKKSKFTRFIVDAVRKQGGRFLLKDNVSGLWNDVGDNGAMTRTSMALRGINEDKKYLTLSKNENGGAVEALEIMNLFDDEIGEWANAPSPLQPRKKQKMENKSITQKPTKNQELTPKPIDTSCVALKKNTVKNVDTCKVLEGILSDMFNKSAATVTSKKSPSSKGLSRYNGVSKTKRKNRDSKFEAKFTKYRLGSYVLEVDAALAYDGAIRARRLKEHYVKINFAVEQDYMSARERELKARGITVDLDETLASISKVKDAVFRAVNKGIQRK